ncbi:MAG: homocysteine methyltransferase [Acidobacteria bacterium]|nr:homocysteine methyltransferase [Acidobacteriota bacterium]
MPCSDPESEAVVALMDGFRASKALFTAVQLGLFDRLDGRAASCAELAQQTDCVPHALERLLGFLCARGLLSVDAAGLYRNTRTAERFLRTDSPETLTGYILYSDRILYRLWGRLEDALHEGTNRWAQEFGAKDDIFDHFFSSDEDKEVFLKGMHGFGVTTSPRVVAAFDLSRFKTFVDLGGGTGHLTIEACKRYPNMQGVVFDLPKVQPVAERYVRAAGMSGRISFSGGTFFDDALPQGDLYAMGRILHDWSEEKVRVLVRRAYEALPAGGALLLAEKLLNPAKDGPATSQLQSLNMLICTEGRERTAAEYEGLLERAGFREVHTAKTGGAVDAVLAVK